MTTRPLTEDVSWFVMKEEASVEPVPFDALARCGHQEERPTCPLDRRYVLRSFR